MPAISEDRGAILQQLESSEEAAARLIAGVSRAQMNWQPDQGRSWSIWQCLDHLARTNRIYCQSMLEAIAHPRQKRKGTSAIRPGWFGRWYICKNGAASTNEVQNGKKSDSGGGRRRTSCAARLCGFPCRSAPRNGIM